MSQKLARGYVVARLTAEASEKLREYAVHPSVFCHHMTVFFEPSQEDFEKIFTPLFGQAVTLVITGMVKDERGQAVIVQPLAGIPANRRAHVTISCADGIQPKYSNEILGLTPEPLNLELSAVIEFVSFPPKS